MNEKQLNDPDFDVSATASQPRSFLEQIPPTYLFIGGMVGGIMILCTIGFFILLTLMLGGARI